MGGTKAMCPFPNYYAVIQMDPKTMIKDLQLDDEQALKEVEAMQPQKYLIYLALPESLPFPDVRCTRFLVSPIGTTLRPPVSEWDITPEMVVPIAPNTQNARGHQPVQTVTPFPFSNCYHWVANSISVRVKFRPEPFDHEHAVEITSAENLALLDSFTDDHDIIAAARRKRRKEALRAKAAKGSSPDIGSNPESTHGDRPEAEAPRNESVPSATSSSSSTSFGYSIPYPYPWGLIPLVDLWLELDEHLSEDTIPSPVGLIEEKKTIQAIIIRAAERKGVQLDELVVSPERTFIINSDGAPEDLAGEKGDAHSGAPAGKFDVGSQPESLPTEQTPRGRWSPLRLLKRAMCMG